MRFCKRTRSGFQKEFTAQKYAYMTSYVWGYWMIIINKKAKK